MKRVPKLTQDARLVNVTERLTVGKQTQASSSFLQRKEEHMKPGIYDWCLDFHDGIGPTFIGRIAVFENSVIGLENFNLMETKPKYLQTRFSLCFPVAIQR